MLDLNKVSPSQTKGQAIENLVANYLLTKGSQLLHRNFRCRTGEIDLIITHQNQLVFVEVRFRRSALYGNAAESVTFGKQQKILRAARYFLCTHPKYKNYACRFDVAAVTLNTHGSNDSNEASKYSIDWIQNAFC